MKTSPVGGERALEPVEEGPRLGDVLQDLEGDQRVERPERGDAAPRHRRGSDASSGKRDFSAASRVAVSDDRARNSTPVKSRGSCPCSASRLVGPHLERAAAAAHVEDAPRAAAAPRAAGRATGGASRSSPRRSGYVLLHPVVLRAVAPLGDEAPRALVEERAAARRARRPRASARPRRARGRCPTSTRSGARDVPGRSLRASIHSHIRSVQSFATASHPSVCAWRRPASPIARRRSPSPRRSITARANASWYSSVAGSPSTSTPASGWSVSGSAPRREVTMGSPAAMHSIAEMQDTSAKSGASGDGVG